MSTLLTTRPGVRERFGFAAARQERLFGDGEGEREVRSAASAPPAPAPAHEPITEPEEPAARTAPTLDAAVSSLWERLSAGEPVACPVCDAPMEPRRSSGPGVVAARCRSCGSTLS